MEEQDTDSALVNFEDDRDDDLEDGQNPDRFRDAVLYGTDWTIGTLVQQIEQGNIDLSPDFQRRDAWTVRTKSRFIESVALQLPIPQIVLAERKEQRGTYIVLDGKQRLLTLAQFASELPPDHALWGKSESAHPVPLRIGGLKVLEVLNGKTYQDLVERPELASLRTQFDNHTIRSALIRNWPDDDYLYEVFIRLNTGSARLSPQELRQAMKPGGFTEFLGDRSANSAILQQVLGLAGPDFRMRDVDMLLRMVAFLTRLTSYRGNLKQFLDETHDYFNSRWEDERRSVEVLVDRIEDGLRFLAECFDGPRKVGRRWAEGQFDAPVNRAVLDVQIASALDHSVRQAVEEGRLDLRACFADVCERNVAFVQAISGTTKSLTAIRTRYDVWRDTLEAAVGRKVDFPRLP
ncbi:DUF262 domain-containing protein [Ralstonia wenshanensis]|uniref:DUF262 domain-containing protein n=1 Tax=Ralstonia wenshanensis TaxID=2842456 RepID=UPI003D9841F0